MKLPEKVDIALEMNKELFNEDLPKLQSMATKLRSRYFGKRVAFYTKPYTPVSVTGAECELSCKHCNKHYLGHMEKASTGKQLDKLLNVLASSGLEGVVLGERRLRVAVNLPYQDCACRPGARGDERTPAAGGFRLTSRPSSRHSAVPAPCSARWSAR